MPKDSLDTKMFLARIYVTLKPTINDPQGQTVLASLKTLGFESAKNVRIGKYLEVLLGDRNNQNAEEQVTAMCDKLLANPVIEDFHYELIEKNEI